MNSMLRRSLPVLVSLCCWLSLLSQAAFATCQDDIINPITDIDYSGIFPVDIAGIPISLTQIKTPQEAISEPICVCGLKVGLKTSFWEPARLEESVKDGYCFASMGFQLSTPSSGYMGGDIRQRSANSDMSSTDMKSQVHHYIFPVWGAVGLFLDLPCLTEKSMDLAYISEVDPTHQNCLLAFILNPEALLFGNPVAQLACIADSIAVNSPGTILDPVSNVLFYCVGSWGSVYPLCGYGHNDNYVEANVLQASRIIFKLGRTGILEDTGVSWCGPVYSPIWNKTNYRLQIFRPVRGHPVPIGTTGFYWASAKNPPFNAGDNASDNFGFVVFRYNKCCQALY